MPLPSPQQPRQHPVPLASGGSLCPFQFIPLEQPSLSFSPPLICALRLNTASSGVLPEHCPGLLVKGCTCEAVQEVPEVELQDSRKLVFIEHPWVPGAVLSIVPAVTHSVLRTALLCVTLPTLQMRKGGTEGLVSCPKSHTQQTVQQELKPRLAGSRGSRPPPIPAVILSASFLPDTLLFHLWYPCQFQATHQK